MKEFTKEDKLEKMTLAEKYANESDWKLVVVIRHLEKLLEFSDYKLKKVEISVLYALITKFPIDDIIKSCAVACEKYLFNLDPSPSEKEIQFAISKIGGITYNSIIGMTYLKSRQLKKGYSHKKNH